MRRYLVTSIVAIVALLGGLGVQSFIGGDAVAKPRRTRIYRCISQLANMSVSAYNMSQTKPATITIRTLDANNVPGTLPDATIQPHHSNAVAVNQALIFIELRSKSRLLVTGVAVDTVEGDDSIHTIRCSP